MNNFVPVKTGDGRVMLVEVEDTNNEYSLTSGKGQEVLKDFKETVDAMKDNARYVFEQLVSLGPEEVEVEFGIKVGVEGKTPFFALAKATGEANYTIKLKWVSEDPAKPGSGKQAKPLPGVTKS